MALLKERLRVLELTQYQLYCTTYKHVKHTKMERVMWVGLSGLWA